MHLMSFLMTLLENLELFEASVSFRQDLENFKVSYGEVYNILEK
jgi:hypothetical protein